MTNEERDLIAKFIARVGGQPQVGSAWGGSVPASSPQLPPIDRDADQFITQQFQTHPEARYRVTQMAFVQEAALIEAQNRIRRLEWEVEQTRNAAQQVAQQHQQQAPQSRGILGSLFGGGQQQPQGNPLAGYRPTMPPPQPQYPPQYQPGMFGRGGMGGGGSGFLGTALAGAAGVAGGMMAANALTGLFSGGHGSSASTAASDSSGGLFGGGGLFGDSSGSSGSPFDTAGATPASDPTAGFADASGGGDPWAGGGATKDFADNGGGQGGGFWNGGGQDSSNVSYDQGGGDSFGGAGGWDSGSGGSDDQT